MKNILLLTDKSLQRYIFTTDNSTDQLIKAIASWPQAFQTRISVIPANLTCFRWLSEHGLTLQEIKWYRIKSCMLCSLPSTNIQGHNQKVIYVDLDVLLLDDISHLWNIFSDFKSMHVMSLGRAGLRYFFHPNFTVYDGLYGLNAGVALVHLENLGKVNFEVNYVKTSQEEGRFDQEGISNTDDQDVLNAYFDHNAEKVLPFSCNWNYQMSMEKCHFASIHGCPLANRRGVSLLHTTINTFFTQSDFTPIYQCFVNNNLYNITATIQCLKNAVEEFCILRSRTCGSQIEFIKPLKRILQRYDKTIQI